MFWSTLRRFAEVLQLLTTQDTPDSPKPVHGMPREPNVLVIGDAPADGPFLKNSFVSDDHSADVSSLVVDQALRLQNRDWVTPASRCFQRLPEQVGAEMTG